MCYLRSGEAYGRSLPNHAAKLLLLYFNFMSEALVSDFRGKSKNIYRYMLNENNMPLCVLFKQYLQPLNIFF